MIRLSLALAVALMGSLAGRAAAQEGCAPPKSSFELIQRGIFEPHGCTLPACHGEAKRDGIDLRAAAAYDSLLHHVEDGDDEDAGESAAERVVAPGDPDESMLWKSLAAKTLQRSDLDATPMPISSRPLSSDELEGVRLWILAGAPERGFVDGVDALIAACPQEPIEDDSGVPTCREDDSTLRLPNLAAEPPADVRLRYVGGHRTLEFTTVVVNKGDGPLIIQAGDRPSQPGQMVRALQIILRRDGSKCAHEAGFMRFGDDGSHWGYGNLVTFELRKDDPEHGDLVAKTSKTSFCLLDTDPIRASDNRPRQYEAHCLGEIGRMGISAGYKDTYSRVYPGQWIDLDADPETPIEAGAYYLINATNPTGLLWESDTSLEDNVSSRRVSVTLAAPAPAGARPTAVPTIAPTSVRTRPSTVRAPRPAGTVRPDRPAPPQRPVRAPRIIRTPRPVRTPVPPRTGGTTATAPTRAVKTVKQPKQPHQPGQ